MLAFNYSNEYLGRSAYKEKRPISGENFASVSPWSGGLLVLRPVLGITPKRAMNGRFKPLTS